MYTYRAVTHDHNRCRIEYKVYIDHEFNHFTKILIGAIPNTNSH
jgi:hypothetical protein